jgi:hypothetical protein
MLQKSPTLLQLPALGNQPPLARNPIPAKKKKKKKAESCTMSGHEKKHRLRHDIS